MDSNKDYVSLESQPSLVATRLTGEKNFKNLNLLQLIEQAAERSVSIDLSSEELFYSNEQAPCPFSSKRIYVPKRTVKKTTVREKREEKKEIATLSTAFSSVVFNDDKEASESSPRSSASQESEKVSPFTADLLNLRKHRQRVRQQQKLFRKPGLEHKSVDRRAGKTFLERAESTEASGGSRKGRNFRYFPARVDGKRVIQKELARAVFPQQIYTRADVSNGVCAHRCCQWGKFPPNANMDYFYDCKDHKCTSLEAPVDHLPVLAKPFLQPGFEKVHLCHYYDPFYNCVKPYFLDDSTAKSQSSKRATAATNPKEPFPYWTEEYYEDVYDDDEEEEEEDERDYGESDVMEQVSETAKTSGSRTSETRQRSVKLSQPRKSVIQQRNLKWKSK